MKKGVNKLISGALLILIGTVLPFACLIPLFFQEKSYTLEAPGSLEVFVKAPGKYVLWNNVTTVYEGRSYSFAKELPGGLSFSLVEKNSGISVPLQGSSGLRYTSGSVEKVSVGSFEIAKAGPYLLTVTGDPEKRIFSFERSFLAKAGGFLLFLIVGLALSSVAGLVAVILIIMGIVDLSRGSNTPASAS